MSVQSQGEPRRPRHRYVNRTQQAWIPKGSVVEEKKSHPRAASSSSTVNGGRGNANPMRRGVKNTNVPQLVQEIQEKMSKGTVECMICYEMVRRSAPIWSCPSCYSIFHLNCIKKWARAPTSVDLAVEKDQGSNWRCPGCQSVQLSNAKNIRYTCFCGKRTDPGTDLYLTPHSCGEPCGKPLDKDPSGNVEERCPHFCVLQCHPGPCPPCKAFAPARQCPCGKKNVVSRCADLRVSITCGQPCDKMLDCQRHRCEKVCHEGNCESCQFSINAVCFCKKKSMIISCGDLVVKGEINIGNGVFSCDSICNQMLGCRNHWCEDICHPGKCGDCNLMPGKIKSCYCGKTMLQVERSSCLDPIPTCEKVCDKLLPCGVHHCNELCHAGDCQPCQVLVSQECRCGSTSRTVECWKTTKKSEMFFCAKPCGMKKNCGRHRCSERCCLLSNSKSAFTEDIDPHFCQIPCGKKLRCGQHSCESLCHSGHCPPCRFTIFTDLSCACGRTSILPPVPCGTLPPSCQLPCSVPQACGHPVTHSCHFGDCPPCAVSIAKECVGGHLVLKNIPCGSKDIRCNKLCGKTRQCGLHACAKPCHPPPCDVPEHRVSESRTCGQTCGAPRRECRHTCSAICHPSEACPDVRCEFPVSISCSCSRITATVPCDFGGSSGGFNIDSVFEASIIQKLSAPLQPVESNGKRIPLSLRKLVCDDECAKHERQKMLADAFDVAPPNLDALFFGENPSTSDLLTDLFRRDPKWVLAVEERCKSLVLGKNRGPVGGLKLHVFCPMMKDKRDAVRLIAERWKLAIGAAGWEPKRFLVVHVLPKSKAPARVIGVKGASFLNAVHPSSFNPLVDMDPRLVVSFLDLPREADISSLVLRFGGECELIWLNDKNALAVFNDPARAATAMRRLEHGSAYQGASVVAQSTATPSPNAWEGTSAASKGNPWKRAVVQEPSVRDESWCGEESWIANSDSTSSSSRLITLESEMASDSTVALDRRSKLVLDGSKPNSSAKQFPGVLPEIESEVADDWEEAYDNANANHVH